MISIDYHQAIIILIGCWDMTYDSNICSKKTGSKLKCMEKQHEFQDLMWGLYEEFNGEENGNNYL